MAHAPNWQAVPLAPADLQPAWPLPTVTPKFSTTSFAGGRPFGCAAGECERWHAGIDLTSAPDGAVVVAPDAGTVVGVDKGWSGTAKALYLRSPGTGLFLVMGGLKDGSPAEFGVAAGTHVTRGQPLGRVIGSYGMIHLETYGDWESRTKNSPWFVGQPPPAGLLNPTAYVQSMEGVPLPAPAPVPKPPPAPAPAPKPPAPQPPAPAPASSGQGFGLVVFLGGAALLALGLSQRSR